MENNILNDIDNLIKEIKLKSDNIGMTSGDMFIILTLELLRGEIVAKKISEITIKACNEIEASTSRFYYHGLYPELFGLLQNVFHKIKKLDSRFYSADITCIGFTTNSWVRYISKASRKLLEDLPTAYGFKKVDD